MNMSFKWDDGGLKKLQQNINAISGQHEIAITELMTDSFIQQHSKFNNFQALIDSSGIKNTKEIGNEFFSNFIASHTTFISWDEMLKVAGTEYTKRKLGF